MKCLMVITLQWCQNECNGVSNRQPYDCLLKRLFGAQIKENIKAPRHWPLCVEFTGDRWIPAQRASDAENVSIWWRRHEWVKCRKCACIRLVQLLISLYIILIYAYNCTSYGSLQRRLLLLSFSIVMFVSAEGKLNMLWNTEQHNYINHHVLFSSSDQIAIPDFPSGAMEHWGLITYRETALLYNDSLASASAKERVALVIAHELAHNVGINNNDISHTHSETSWKTLLQNPQFDACHTSN